MWILLPHLTRRTQSCEVLKRPDADCLTSVVAVACSRRLDSFEPTRGSNGFSQKYTMSRFDQPTLSRQLCRRVDMLSRWFRTMTVQIRVRFSARKTAATLVRPNSQVSVMLGHHSQRLNGLMLHFMYRSGFFYCLQKSLPTFA